MVSLISLIYHDLNIVNPQELIKNFKIPQNFNADILASLLDLCSNLPLDNTLD